MQILFILWTSLFILSVYGQAQRDSVSLGSGYGEQVYYSFSQGIIKTVSNSGWDLAFDLSSFGFSVRINDAENRELYETPYAVSDWTNVDTSGMSAWKKLYNADTSWNIGAFNASSDTSNPYDLGWGMYNSITHIVSGNKIFVLKYPDGSVKKILIEGLNAGKWIFKYASLDNSVEVTDTIKKSDFPNKNFIYYSLKTQKIIDREPLNNAWDILFTKYTAEVAPGMFYGVTGVLQNRDVLAYKDPTAPSFQAVYSPSAPFSSEINKIGHDWKTFDMNTYSYTLKDSLTYFVQTQNGEIWKLGFTKFEGSASGKIVFQKELIATANIKTLKDQVKISVYPTLTQGELFLKSEKRIKVYASIHSLLGTQILGRSISLTPDSPATLNLEELPEGVYFLSLQFKDGSKKTIRFIVQ